MIAPCRIFLFFPQGFILVSEVDSLPSHFLFLFLFFFPPFLSWRQLHFPPFFIFFILFYFILFFSSSQHHLLSFFFLMRQSQCQTVKDKDKSQDNIQVQIQKSLQDKAFQDKDYTVTTDKHQSS
jgi:hypothetical protein